MKRTCIGCRGKFLQKSLLRLQCNEKKLTSFSGKGRSFYICKECLENNNNLEKALFRNCKNKDNYIEQLKEIVGNG